MTTFLKPHSCYTHKPGFFISYSQIESILCYPISLSLR